MSEKIDRRIGNNRTLLVTTIVVIFIIALTAGSYVWLRMSDPSVSPAQAPSSSVLPPPSDDALMVTVFVPGNGSMLSAGFVSVKRQPDTHAQARETLISAFADMVTVQAPVLKELKFRGFFLDEAGTAYVDLSSVPENGIKATAWEELLGLYAIVNTLSQNFEEIKQVRFLLEGREAQTLAGHIDLSRIFTKRMDLVKQ